MDFYFFYRFFFCVSPFLGIGFFSPVLKGNRWRIGGQRKRAAVFPVFWPLSQVIVLFFRILFSFFFGLLVFFFRNLFFCLKGNRFFFVFETFSILTMIK